MSKIPKQLKADAAAWAAMSFILLLAALPARAETFDTPLQQRAIDLGRSPYSNGQSKLTCDYFGAFMVKQLDLGREGAEWLAIVPARPGHLPACTRARAASEKFIPASDWCGYFEGVKEQFVFLSACDARNSGQDFAVYDAHSGSRVF